jgi:hypothetical protein
MSAARPPYSGGHGAQGVVAGGLWVRCGGTSGRNLLEGLARTLRALWPQPNFLVVNISREDECRTYAKFRVVCC